MDLTNAIKSVNSLNIDWNESTSSKETFLLKEENDSSFIISDSDEEILILIEFVDFVDLHNIIFTALPLEDNDDTSPPKEICLYKATNVCVNFDDMSSLSADKVIEGKAKKLSKGQKVSLRKKLAFRQIKYLIIYVKANQSDSEKTHLHKIKINGTCNAKLNENKQQIIKTFDESKYIQRIDELFEKQQSNKMSDEDLYDLVCSKYPNEDIAHFLNDYHQFIKNMDSNRLYLRQRNAVCSQKDCVFMKRRHRFKQNEKGNKQSMIRQILRQIHVLCHQYDEEQKMKKDKNYKRQIIKMKKAECRDMDGHAPQSNRFVIDFRASSAPLMNGKYLKYSLGFKFYYHSFYKDKDRNRLEKKDGFEFMPNQLNWSAPNHQTFKDWYVSPKYKDLKEEIVYGGHLTLDQVKSEIAKAEINICTAEAKALRANGEFEERYNVQNGSAITVNHMLCVMLYTNYGVLQNKLSKTFRKLTETESDEQLKERHTAFVHISRLMTETIHCFGNNELTGTVHHGVNAPTIFQHFSVKFYGPTSTTTSESIAINFATNAGTVITIQGAKGCAVSNHLDCELWSDYPWEKEKLFIGMNYLMHIVNVHDIQSDIEYKEWIDVIRAFDHILINGTSLMSPISQFVEENVHLLIDSVKSNSVKSYIPEYILDTFNNIRVNTRNLEVDLNLLSKDIFWKHKDSLFVYYGGKKFENVYFDNAGNIKWAFINSLFPNLRRVQIVSSIHEDDVSMYSFSKSILLTDGVLNDILVFLKVSNMKVIDIFAPQNNLFSLQQQIAKFSAKYKEIGYHLDIKQSVNQCIVFGIESVSGK